MLKTSGASTTRVTVGRKLKAEPAKMVCGGTPEMLGAGTQFIFRGEVTSTPAFAALVQFEDSIDAVLAAAAAGELS